MNNKPIRHSADLIQSGLPEGHPLEDKVYVSCKLTRHGRVWVADIDQDCPLVGLNQEWAALAHQTFGADVVTVKDVQQRKYEGLSLLSAGVFLHLDDKLALLKRDSGAPSYPGALTEPAGRCGEIPSRTIPKELNEELMLRHDQDGLTEIFPLAGADFEREAIAIRKQQIEKLNLNKAVVMPPIVAARETGNDMAIVWADHSMIDRVSGDHWFDAQNNTLEIRAHYRLASKALPTGFEVRDGEPYGREAGFYKLSDLQGQSMTPCLAHYAATRLRTHNPSGPLVSPA